MMNDWNGGGWGWGAWFAMALMMLVFWGAIVAVVIAVLRSPSRQHEASGRPAGDGGEQALRILDERFARGEIDAEEYTRRRDLLRAR